MDNQMSIKKATIIYGGAKYATIIMQLVISAILSRLLTPNDYGIVAIVAVFTTLFGKLSNLGLGTAVTQYRDLSHQDVQDIFTFTEYFSLALTIVFMLTAYPIARFYGNIEYVNVVLLLGISVFFNALNMIPNALLLKEKQFLKVGIRTIVTTVGSGVIAIILAFCGAKYYALVIQSILNSLIQFIWNYCNSELKICFRYSSAPIKRVKSYSTNQFTYNILNYFAQNLDNLLTGKLMGNEMLAYYNKGYTLMRYPINNIAHVITPVLHPILAEHQDDRKYIYQQFVRLIKTMSLIGIFITGICFWADTEIIICYYGEQWYGAVDAFRWLSLCVGAQLMNALFGSVYQSIGCTKEMLMSGIAHISVSLAAIFIGAYTKSIEMLALFVSVSMLIKFVIESTFLIYRCFRYSLFDYFKVFFSDVVIMVVIFAIPFIVGDIKGIGLWTSLFVKITIMGVVYVIMLIITKQYTYLLSIIPEKIKRIFKRKIRGV